jgi:hypothetical protein
LVEATEGCNINQGKSAVGSSPQNSKANFVDLRDDASNFQKLTKISPKGALDRNTRIISFLNMPSSFHAKWQGGGG